jgi:hypothetical protein
MTSGWPVKVYAPTPEADAVDDLCRRSAARRCARPVTMVSRAFGRGHTPPSLDACAS